MSAYDAAPRPRRRMVTAVLLAVAALAVAGAAFGYVVGTNDKADKVGGRGPAGAGPGAGPGAGQTSAARSTRAAAPRPSTVAPTGKRCPDFIGTAVAARGGSTPLTLRLYVATEKSEVWICRDGSGKLWYQGHRLDGDGARYPARTPVEGVDGLLLDNVNGLDNDRYLAVNVDNSGNETRYTVSRTELSISQAGKTSTERVVDTDG